MDRTLRLLEALSEWTGRCVAWLTLAMVLTTFTVVVLRYVFDTGWIAMQETITYMHALVFLLGAAYTLKHDGHVRVDIIYRKMPVRSRAWVDLLGVLFLLLPMCLFITWISWDYVQTAWELRESSREAGGLPWVYLLKTSILLMTGLMILQGIAQLLRSLLVLMGHQPRPQNGAEGMQEI